VAGPRAREHTHDVGDEDLVALGGGAETGRLDDGRAEPVALLEGGIAGTDAHTHLHRAGFAGAVAMHSLLHRDGSGDGVARRVVGHHHRVADGLHLGATGDSDGSPELVEVIPAQRIRSRVSELLGERGRTDEIGEQDRDQSRPGQFPHPQAPPYRRELEQRYSRDMPTRRRDPGLDPGYRRLASLRAP